jgi:hypothetical protein
MMIIMIAGKASFPLVCYDSEWISAVDWLVDWHWWMMPEKDNNLLAVVVSFLLSAIWILDHDDWAKNSNRSVSSLTWRGAE